MGVGSEWGPKVGERMQAAAAAVGLSAVAISEEMGVSASTVHKWWRGEREPSASSLYRYCQLVGRDTSEMYGEEFSPRLLQALLNIFDPVMAGRPLGRAVEQVAGHPLTEEQRATLDAGSQVMREALGEQARQAWDLLSDPEKLEVLADVMRRARQAAQGHRGGSSRSVGIAPPLF